MSRQQELHRTNFTLFTPRQAKVVELLGQRKTQAQIAKEMDLTPKSVSSYISLAYDRLPSLEGLEGKSCAEALAEWSRRAER